jgi:potassium-dependent mechanosensitive channel
MFRVRRLVLPLISVLIFDGGTALGEPAAVSPEKSSPTPTPVPLIAVAVEAQSAMMSLQAIDVNLAGGNSRVDAIDRSLANLTSEIDARIAEDMRLLAASPSLDQLHRLRSTWQNFDDNLSAVTRNLSQHATTLEETRAHLEELHNTWQETLESAKKPDTPQPVLQGVQNVIDSVERARRAAESLRSQVLTLQIRLSQQQARARIALSAVEQLEERELESLLVRDSPPIWSGASRMGGEMMEQSGESFSSEVRASAAFIKRFPFNSLIYVALIVLIATALQWMRRRIEKLAERNPDLQGAVPIVALPVSTAFVLSSLISPSVYPLAPSLVQAFILLVALVPTVVLLRRFLEPHLYPILNALLVLYFLDQLRVLMGSLPELARFVFLGEVLGAFLFLVWVLRNRHLRTTAGENNRRFLRALRAIAKIGVIFLPVAFITNIFGYVNLGNVLGIIFLRSAYVAAMLYAAIRIFEGLVIIALHVRPLGSLRIINLHRAMLQRRIGYLLGFLAFLFWLYLVLRFFGLLTPVTTNMQALLNANIGVGSINTSSGRILAFLIAVWVSFLVSRFLRFLLEEDVYHHFHLAPGTPYAISTMLHYAILLLGFVLGLGALGIDLGKITILAGAFSVGIGFGLQNVINNFVSGLILLFERPIKIGDVIEVSGVLGEVRRIGIRASVIRSADGSEVIVPNGSLISSQVTNWTFSDQQRAVEVSVNVVSGVDTQRVVELLKSVAASNPDVVKEPAPQVYMINFAAGGETFQLRVWTDRSREWAQLRSDLAVAINSALAREKIAIA